MSSRKKNERRERLSLLFAKMQPAIVVVLVVGQTILPVVKRENIKGVVNDVGLTYE